MTDVAAAPSTSASLWDELRPILRLTLQVFGDPRDLFDDVVLPRAEARRLASWIASLEVAARALLTALAAALPELAPARRRERRPALPESAGAEPQAAMTDAQDAPSPDAAPPETPDSEAWAGVAFRFTPCAPRGGGSRGAPGERRFLAVRGLAFRLEALIRVAAAPERYARRLARRLRAEPALAARALRKLRRRGGHPPPYEELVEEALALARGAEAPETG